MKRVLALLAVTLVALACATTLKPRTFGWAYEISNRNWSRASVEFFCGTTLISHVRGIETGETVRGRVRLSSCTDPRFRVRLLANAGKWVSPSVRSWDETTTLILDIENFLALTSFRVRE